MSKAIIYLPKNDHNEREHLLSTFWGSNPGIDEVYEMPDGALFVNLQEARIHVDSKGLARKADKHQRWPDEPSEWMKRQMGVNS